MDDWQVQYDDTTQTLTVTFPNGRSYDYEAVPPDVAAKFAADDDKPRFFNRNIRGRY